MSGSGTLKREKAPTSSSMRTTLNEQLAKLQVKHNAELDFLEDIRAFTKQRSVIEKDYAQSLQRLTQQYLTKRDIKRPPEVDSFDRIENRGLLEVWKMLLTKTEEIATARQRVSELLLTKVSEEMRQQKRIKEQAFKKYYEVAHRMSTEIQESVKEMTTTKKSYNDLEKVCADARQKFTEAESRLKKRDLKFFESYTTLERSHKKYSDRLKSCQKRLTVGRNDYLLAVSTTNAHLHRHASQDLPTLMQTMDGEMYQKARDGYMLYAQIEADSANMIKAQFEDLREQSYLVNREYVVACFLHKNPVLKKTTVYKFEPFGQDQVCALSRDDGAEIFLDKDARKWATKLTKDNSTIAEKQKQVKGLQSVTMAYAKTPEFGTSDAQAEALQKTEALQEEIRQLEVQRTKAETRLEALRNAGVDVSKWLQKAVGDQEGKSGSLELFSGGLAPEHYHSSLSLGSATHNGSQEFEWGETSSIRSGMGPDDNDVLSIGSNRSEAPKYCIALYEYKAQRSDELDIRVDEELEVLEWDDGDGWCRGKSRVGLEGYFPQNYVQPSSRSSSPPSQTAILWPQLASMWSHTNGTYGTNGTHSTNGSVTLLRSLYEYTAQFDEELSFPEGAVIELVRTDDNGVDDGWWEGRYEGRVGVFPSVVVEIINGVDDPSSAFDITPIGSMVTADMLPPPDSPPPVPPNYPPPGISPQDLGIGPSAIPIPDSNSNFTSPSGSPSKRFPTSSSPFITIEMPTPDPRDFDFSRTWRLDSFDDFEGDESIV